MIKIRFVNIGSLALTLAAVMVAAGGASAKERKPKTSENQARVVAHIPFEGLFDVDMALQKKVKDKYYLYVQHSKDQGVSIVDISKPAEPKVVGTTPWPDPGLSSRMNVTGDLAIVAENNVERKSSSNDDLVLWDLSNPATPRIVQKFTGVVKWLQDERDFIYVLNADGLWIVVKPMGRGSKQAEPSDNYGG